MAAVLRAVTIGGSDSGGGSGIQADLKTFAALGVYGSSVITAVKAQNTLGITEVLELPPEMVGSQIDAVLSDIGADAVKTGILSSTPIIEVVCERLRAHAVSNLVVDPEIIAKSGERLLDEAAVEAMRTVVIPLARVVTPNIPEAEALTDRQVKSVDDARDAAREIVAMGARAVVVKGGHLDGAGCTFASAIAAGLATGQPVRDAVSHAKKYVSDAIRHAFPMGRGHGPVDHFYELWEQMESAR
jgi:hydroxymethylpyrimidine/phosphomethylpyrimidine kinase